MNPRVFAAILIVIAVGIGVAFFASQKDDEAVAGPTAAPATAESTPATESPQAVVILTEDGFSPRTITVNAGDSVEFRNESGSPAIIASDPHPQHTDLSEFESDTVASGGTYTFTFDRAGTFGMHNHLNASQTGEVVVK